MNQKIKQDQISRDSKLEVINELNTRFGQKQVNVEIGESEVVSTESKYHKKIRSKLEVLKTKIDKFKEIDQSFPFKSAPALKLKQN